MARSSDELRATLTAFGEARVRPRGATIDAVLERIEDGGALDVLAWFEATYGLAFIEADDPHE
jgi:hypothetical protein